MFGNKRTLVNLEKKLVDYVYNIRNDLFNKLEEFTFFIKENYVTQSQFHSATQNYDGLKTTNDAQSMEIIEMKQKLDTQDILINKLIKENEEANKKFEEQVDLNKGIVKTLQAITNRIETLEKASDLLDKYVEGANELSLMTLHTLTELVPEEVEQGKLNYIKNTRRN